VVQLGISSVESVLELLAGCTYRLDVPPEFVARFFEDRRLINELTRAHLEKERKFADLLHGATMQIELQLGTHLFGFSTVEEHFALDSLVRVLKPRKIVEIGVFRGQTSLTMCRALSQSAGGGSLLGIDVDGAAVEIAREVLTACGLAPMFEFIAGHSNGIIHTVANADLIFIDGDHLFESAARDFVASYNILGEGGVIALHDVGSRVWGFHQGPGWLFHRVLPALLGDRIRQSALDSLCRELTMRFLGPDSGATYRYCKSDEESRALARITSADIIDGLGGMGVLVKLDGAHKLSLDEVLSLAPGPEPVAGGSTVRQPSRLGRAARKIASWIP